MGLDLPSMTPLPAVKPALNALRGQPVKADRAHSFADVARQVTPVKDGGSGLASVDSAEVHGEVITHRLECRGCDFAPAVVGDEGGEESFCFSLAVWVSDSDVSGDAFAIWGVDPHDPPAISTLKRRQINISTRGGSARAQRSALGINAATVLHHDAGTG